jgi:hypothetical protein
MGPRLSRLLAILIWILTPPAQWIAEWLEHRRQRRLGRVSRHQALPPDAGEGHENRPDDQSQE